MNIKRVLLVLLAIGLITVSETHAGEFLPPLAVGRTYSMLFVGDDDLTDVKIVGKGQGSWVRVAYAKSPKATFWLNLQQVTLVQE